MNLKLYFTSRFSCFIMFLIVIGIVSCNGGKNRLFTSLSHHRTGINFRNWVKESETFNSLEYSYLYNGAGVAVGDINNGDNSETRLWWNPAK